ncbi:protein KTI12 homolog [Oppia nitens]|uniref:protein KTI12 homolog n=1 Tax=Oppia nitens TaxID=1686743 RepID=UPI0023DB1D34|nr:protein KTI12 homolog [Oppia nitens]
MPLIIMCGLPLTGKTYFVNRLKQCLDEKHTNRRSIIISWETKLGDTDRNVLFANSKIEREMRSWLKSEVERFLTGDNLVILDANNYIKGFRYELYCTSKERKTTHCVIEVTTDLDIAWNRNQLTGDTLQETYSRETFDALIQRYEKPQPNNRWDSPLIVIDGNSDGLPIDEIISALYERKPPKPNLSTQSPPLSATNSLYELDLKTQQVVRDVHQCIQNGQMKNIMIPESKQTLNLNKSLSMAELNKMRRLFINYTKTHPISDNQLIATLFVQFINKSV